MKCLEQKKKKWFWKWTHASNIIGLGDTHQTMIFDTSSIHIAFQFWIRFWMSSIVNSSFSIIILIYTYTLLVYSNVNFCQQILKQWNIKSTWLILAHISSFCPSIWWSRTFGLQDPSEKGNYKTYFSKHITLSSPTQSHPLWLWH